ncbi:MAG: hypothetical protein A2735_01400 [Candidatus Yanofskybacteria bacterium RIFCSPHIGHO2_01_FULL_41_21]|uniref:Uncharacterized protein n=1 Tax=Candidatus Yanofskybacteria bacterium RIFCSPHIGHO2_01_FULL_41_21 TaxID=1802660 RepID=A0A1F8ECU8_9BACT|nr:MAG: hypothetical protein A2735_01400 [Candidatus Yanofskybacteria bacterium RIFCSPHIGHO2_01_FULL_41_21]
MSKQQFFAKNQGQQRQIPIITTEEEVGEKAREERKNLRNFIILVFSFIVIIGGFAYFFAILK